MFMKKKYVLILGIVIVVVTMISFSLFLIHLEDKNRGKFNKLPSIKEKAKDKENFIVVVTNSDKDTSSPNFCMRCEDSLKFIERLEKLYNLNIIYFDKNYESSTEYYEIIKYLDVREFPTKPPAVFYFRDGVLTFIDNEIAMESEFKRSLFEQGFIDEKELKREIQINSLDEYKEIKERSLIFIYTYNDESYKYRDDLYKLSQSLHFNYYIFMTGLARTSDLTKMFMKKYGNKYKVPSLAVVENEKIIDYYSDNFNSDKIRKFLNKNKIILG